MGQILHGCATTTEAVRRAIQNSQESLRGQMLSRMPKAPAKPARSVLDCIEHGATILPYKDVPLDQG
ncbi:hypothetical protein DCG74_15645 [Bradyrhizobium sp. WBAH42]|nr:hypothetical protein DCG74_15645 [Bradyrhizobium sp. WBAH42]